MSTSLTDTGQLTCGALSSSAMLMTLQPLFNIKNAAMSDNPNHPLKKLFREMTAGTAWPPYHQMRVLPREFYRGMLPNLGAVVPAQAASFWGYAATLRYLADNPDNPSLNDKRKAALMGGLAAAFPANFFERLMIAQQE